MQARRAHTSPPSLLAHSCFLLAYHIQYVSTDTKRIQDAAPYLQMVWSGPYQIILSLAMLYSTLGSAFIAGVALILALIPASFALSAFLVRLQSAVRSQPTVYPTPLFCPPSRSSISFFSYFFSEFCPLSSWSQRTRAWPAPPRRCRP